MRVAQGVGQGCDGASAAATGRRGGVATPLREIAVHNAPVQLQGIEKQAREKNCRGNVQGRIEAIASLFYST